jgi:7-carboxy-7-deazaguanine synthase
MTYVVKEIFYTLQGEGTQVGRPAVFLRFTGCNLWTGLDADRNSALCRFCDTDFIGTDGTGGGKFVSPEQLANRVSSEWPQNADSDCRFVVCTGGEPALQLDEPLIRALHRSKFEVAIETNGTLPLPRGLDWVCVSPKANTSLRVSAGDELKLVFPQAGAEPHRFEHLAFDSFLLQPMHGLMLSENTQKAIEYCMAHPRWRLSLQTHKILGLR